MPFVRTNSRIEDLREAAKAAKGYQVDNKVRAMIVPGSMLIKKQAEDEGLAKIFTDAGFERSEAGCSMCLGMNEDILQEGKRCASTSNRNFEGSTGTRRQNSSRFPVDGGSINRRTFMSMSEIGNSIDRLTDS